MAEDLAVRYRDAVLIDDEQKTHHGDFLLHPDGAWSISKGDEDVSEDIDGSSRLLTRTFQNWHTHLAMQLNARDFSDGFPLKEWLEQAIFPTEERISVDMVRAGSNAGAAELIRTGSSFCADMYFYPATTADVLDNAGLRGLIGGPVSDWALPSHPDAGSALNELDGLLAQNGKHSRIEYAIATHSVYLCTQETLEQARDLAAKLKRMSKSEANEFYSIHSDKPFYDELTDFMSSGHSMVLALKKDNAVLEWRKTIGATNPDEADEGTIRKDFASSLSENAVHGSDSDENAIKEINFFFSGTELI